jgi:ATP-dependent Clp protease ATP-binding subunit ClpX
MAEPVCSFCGRTKQDVKQLIAGARAFICDGCVQLCVGMLFEQPQDWSKGQDRIVSS